MTTRSTRALRWLLAGALIVGVAACGDDDKDTSDTTEATSGDTGTDSTSGDSEPPEEGEPITLAANPWTGSMVNAQVAKAVLESRLNTEVTISEVDENVTWEGLDDGSIDAVLEVWPSGHVEDYATYIDDKGTVVDIGPLGPSAKIGWYIPKATADEYPELTTWEGFQDEELAGLFATAESGDLGQFLMGDPSYVSYDEQIIANLELPLKFVVAGTEAALITAIQDADANGTPLLLQFWQPHWLHSQVELVEVKLPDVTEECSESAASGDGLYACDYPVDELYKAASADLEDKNAAAFEFLSNFTLTTDQQNEIAAMVDGEGMEAAEAAETWVEANADIVDAWLA